MILFLALQAAAVAAPAPPADRAALALRFDQCVALTRTDAARAEADANAWALAGGGYLARQCLGMGHAARGQWPAAAAAFEAAAREAEAARDDRVAVLWAQAGNARLAAGEPAAARTALDAALTGGRLDGLALGEAHLDRARALVALGQSDAARLDLDAAKLHAAADPLAWLLSAALYRRAGDLIRARADIDRALGLAADDASIQLEAGNIFGLSGDGARARAAFERVVALVPGTARAVAAQAALAQFSTPR